MLNPIVEALQTQVGQKIENSPSPVSRWLQGTLLSVEEGMLRVEVSIREEMTNPMGILHGGAAALIIDDVIGATVYTLNRDVFYTSTNLNVDYLNPAQTGERIIAVGQIVRAGNTIINASCRIMSEKGLIIAKGTSNLVRTHIGKGKANALPPDQEDPDSSKGGEDTSTKAETQEEANKGRPKKRSNNNSRRGRGRKKSSDQPKKDS